MRAQTKQRLVLVFGLLLTPILSFFLFAGAATYDGGILGSALIVGAPLTLYGTGFYLVLNGFEKRINEQHSTTT